MIKVILENISEEKFEKLVKFCHDTSKFPNGTIPIRIDDSTHHPFDRLYKKVYIILNDDNRYSKEMKETSKGLSEIIYSK